MAMNINDMKSNLRFGGARPTLFQVQVHNPIVAGTDLKAPFMIQAASLPEMTLGNIMVPYMGRLLPEPGDRQFQPWSIEVINDEDFFVRNGFETWQNRINSLEGNVRNFPTSESSQFTSSATVTQLSKTGKPLRVYKFVNVWPAQIGQIALSWSATDQIETFPVTFFYDTFEVSGATGNAGGV